MPKHRIEQNIERSSSYPDRFRWNVGIFVDEDEALAIIEASGIGNTREEAIECAREFRRWAIQIYLSSRDEDVF